MSRKLKLRKGTSYHYFEWGSEAFNEVTVWHAGGDDSVLIDGRMDKSQALAAGVTFNNPYN